ncbi:MAG TPA: hypothetical protein VGJ21_08565 [Terracidiphilus sp.]|jgi:hypothetical protein
MTDPTYVSVYFAYFLFFLFAGGAVFFFLRSLKDGYLGSNSEEPKYRMLKDDREDDSSTNPERAS